MRPKQVSKRARAQEAGMKEAEVREVPPPALLKKRRKPKVVHLGTKIKRCLRATWMDGRVWDSNETLSKLLSAMLQEGTDAPRPVPPNEWQLASRKCCEWTIGENLGPRTAAGSFQYALLSLHTIRGQTHTIVGWWFRTIKNLTLARSVHSVDMELHDVDEGHATRYILHINHELARINNNSSKKDAPKRQAWYTLPDEMLRRDDQDDSQFQEEHGHQQHQPKSNTPSAATSRPKILRENEDPVEAPLEAVVGMKHCPVLNCVLYKCRWKQWGPDADTWEPESHLEGGKDAIQRFMTRQKETPGAAKKTPAKGTPKKGRTPGGAAKKTSAKGTTKKGETPGGATKTPAKATTKKGGTPRTGQVSRKRGAPGDTTSNTQRKKPCVSETHEGGEKEPVQQNQQNPKRLPNASLKDKSKLVAGALIWVKYYGETSDLEWFQAQVIIVAETTEVPSARVVRVSFLDGQKENLNLKGLTDAEKLHKRNPEKYEVFDWSSDLEARCCV